MHFVYSVVQFFVKLIRWVRFGVMIERVTTTAGDHIEAEIEYRNRWGKIVGYWAYGYWQPNLPYKGGLAWVKRHTAMKIHKDKEFNEIFKRRSEVSSNDQSIV